MPVNLRLFHVLCVCVCVSVVCCCGECIFLHPCETLGDFMKAVGANQRVFNLLDRVPRIKVTNISVESGALPLSPEQLRARQLLTMTGHVQFVDVSADERETERRKERNEGRKKKKDIDIDIDIDRQAERRCSRAAEIRWFFFRHCFALGYASL